MSGLKTSKQDDVDDLSEFGGVFAVINDKDAARHTFFGLYAIQHRGQDSAGISVFNGEPQAVTKKAAGLVAEIFKEADLELLCGDAALGQVRSTAELKNSNRRIQPKAITIGGHSISIVMNGYLLNSKYLKNWLENKGSIIHSGTDCEVILHLLAHQLSKSGYKQWQNKDYNEKAKILSQALAKTLSGAKDIPRPLGVYSLLLMVDGVLLAARDPLGLRPLSYGQFKDSKAWAVCSETCAFDLLGVQYFGEINPGSIMAFPKGGEKFELLFTENVQTAFCLFELIYFSRPDSKIYGKSVYQTRKKTGVQLAVRLSELYKEFDFLVPFPDSGNYAALGFSQKSQVPIEMAMIRNHYVSRTFIQPTQEMREFSVRMKLNPVACMLKNKKIAIIDDSVVRGTTGKSRVDFLKNLGLKSIHMLIACPPIIKACNYGVCRSNLLAEGLDFKAAEKKIADFMGLSGANFLPLEDLIESSGFKANQVCSACFGGSEPVDILKNIKYKF